MSHFPLTSLVLGCLILAGPGAAAAEKAPAISFEVRGRVGFALAQPNNLQRNAIGLGFGATFALPLPGRLGVEVGYAYKPGNYYLETIKDPPATLTWVNPSTGVAAQVAPNPIDRTYGASDARVNYLEGLSVRAWYEGTFPFLGKARGWHAGLQIGGAQFKHEVRGDIMSKPWGMVTSTSPQPGSWRDNYWYAQKSHQVPLSPYIGLSTEWLPDTRFELNLVLLRYQSLNYVHVTGSGTYTLAKDSGSTPRAIGMMAAPNGFPADHVDTRQQIAPHLEVGFSYHF
ncbi:hypothetical protein [Mesoterricola sediminis]|uniref:Outer membrane protein beta-barrel domain-containing protein n=1 Tax=Mesoterricola sediminis TaxID=2927980 RepID=A0AA48GQN5_9BACT|nr:hypothetical protein [Mesoterricola sediminis]BDU75819.1 hypothetical protein METESE_07770 [Mesoterricola sediminis]